MMTPTETRKSSGSTDRDKLVQDQLLARLRQHLAAETNQTTSHISGEQLGAASVTSSSCTIITGVYMRADYEDRRTNLTRRPFNHLIGTCAREHSRLRVDTGLRSVSSRQGSRNTRDTREHTDLGAAVPETLSDNRLVETTRYRVQCRQAGPQSSAAGFHDVLVAVSDSDHRHRAAAER
ncbi:hypothetical protein EYF80_049271 [Liparis tanakae]|uniref:Uncharacterized protein n=1 Tax=Liparis tanakae TaxID=230148 RepID=A0A4Z2FI07_9TELE|nr:hypothetical protein EYF80_049271 [Liparis tanakae]